MEEPDHTGVRNIQWFRGLKTGLKTTWELSKIVFPVTLAVTILRETPVIDVLAGVVEPATSWFGLPGEAAIPLVLGNLVNLYAAIGAILTMDLTVKQVFVLSVILSFAHNLILESAFLRKVGISISLIVSIRLALAAFFGGLVHLIWDGGEEKAQFGWVPAVESNPAGLNEVLVGGLQTAASGVLQLAAVVIPLMIAIQIMHDCRVLDRSSKWIKLFIQPLGISSRGSVAIASGLFFGLIYGTGVIIQQAKEKKFSQREMTLILVFLASCHAAFEDTLIFLPLVSSGIWILLLLRLFSAIVLTLVISRFWPANERRSVVSNQ
ncbi:nucleoside recognition domain-containing protein [Desmospora profundinema]|uniref:Nucleoside transporter/FeoB GTPase Gate domain-containing protein n=1 Tax=Desmospora profundinema TaxID=1571184 RepID=A0ABU1IJI5_9BACL|nr:nucleoside recognition domain-containing protein [Desmospora profundinema]MDR6224159.1 hypothetical protein [Desmospora profundinema]